MKNNKLIFIALIILVVLSMTACAEKMQSVSDIPEEAREKIVEENETERKIVDVKTVKETEAYTEKETSIEEETSIKEESDANVDANYDEYVDNSESNQDSGFSLLKEEETEDCIEKHLSLDDIMGDNSDYFKYGMTPIKWVYIGPNKQLVSNNKPKSSQGYSIRKKTMSGEKGCFVPIYTANTKNATDTYDARLLIFEDTTRDFLNFEFKNKASELEYEGKSVLDIYKDAGHEVDETDNGILIVDGNFLNVIYITDLEKMLGIGG